MPGQSRTCNWVAPDASASREGRTIIPRWLLDLATLTKLRVNVLVVGTAFVGFALNARIRLNWFLLFWTLIGTGLIAAAAAATNQIMEEKFDRNMERTKNRPLPTGRFGRMTAALLAAIMFGAGCLSLNFFVNLRATVFAAVTFAVYAFAYTPLKRRTVVCVLVGAIAGALPVLVGWAASGAKWNTWTTVATVTLFLWQIPHFLAIAWWRKSDYSRAGFRILPLNDQEGLRTAGWALAFAFAMIAVSISPAIAYHVKPWYVTGELALGAAMIACSTLFLLDRNAITARRLFIMSLAYLPGMYSLMLLNCNLS